MSEDERKTVVGDAFASRNDYCLKSIRFKGRTPLFSIDHMKELK